MLLFDSCLWVACANSIAAYNKLRRWKMKQPLHCHFENEAARHSLSDNISGISLQLSEDPNNEKVESSSFRGFGKLGGGCSRSWPPQCSCSTRSIGKWRQEKVSNWVLGGIFRSVLLVSVLEVPNASTIPQKVLPRKQSGKDYIGFDLLPAVTKREGKGGSFHKRGLGTTISPPRQQTFLGWISPSASPVPTWESLDEEMLQIRAPKWRTRKSRSGNQTDWERCCNNLIIFM